MSDVHTTVTNTANEMLVEWQTLAATQEDLDPELAMYMDDHSSFGPFIRHPLVYSMMHTPAQNALVNKQLRGKRQAVAQAEDANEWHSYVYLHERPYRVDAFVQIATRLSDTEYWSLLADIWMDSENIRQNPSIWQRLLRSKRLQREAMMDEDEREALAGMDGVIPVYQGHTQRRHDGWSWTTDRSKAEWFARRFSDFERSPAALTEGVVKKRHVIAYLQRRGESEILVDRARVKDRETVILT